MTHTLPDIPKDELVFHNPSNNLHEMGWFKFVQTNRRFFRFGLPYVGTIFVSAWCLKEALSYRITVKDKEQMSIDDMELNPAERAELEEKLIKEAKGMLPGEDTLKKWNNPDVTPGTYSRARPNEQ